jgi:hypothetical protein
MISYMISYLFANIIVAQETGKYDIIHDIIGFFYDIIYDIVYDVSIKSYDIMHDIMISMISYLIS